MYAHTHTHTHTMGIINGQAINHVHVIFNEINSQLIISRPSNSLGLGLGLGSNNSFILIINYSSDSYFNSNLEIKSLINTHNLCTWKCGLLELLRLDCSIVIVKFSFITDIFIGFEQQRYTVFEADAYGDLTSIPVITANGLGSEFQFDVMVQILDDSAEVGKDFQAMPRNTIQFLANEQSIDVTLEILQDDSPEGEEQFFIELTTSGAPRVMIGGGLFGRTTVVIKDDDG